jgi:hypothetical protein
MATLSRRSPPLLLAAKVHEDLAFGVRAIKDRKYYYIAFVALYTFMVFLKTGSGHFSLKKSSSSGLLRTCVIEQILDKSLLGNAEGYDTRSNVSPVQDFQVVLQISATTARAST